MNVERGRLKSQVQLCMKLQIIDHTNIYDENISIWLCNFTFRKEYGCDFRSTYMLWIVDCTNTVLWNFWSTEIQLQLNLNRNSHDTHAWFFCLSLSFIHIYKCFLRCKGIKNSSILITLTFTFAWVVSWCVKVWKYFGAGFILQ